MFTRGNVMKYLASLCFTAIIFLTGSELYSQSFGLGLLRNAAGTDTINIPNPTSLQFGQDGKLYLANQEGNIFVFSIFRQDANDYRVTNIDTIDLILNIPNHDDDGSPAPTVTNRQVTGIRVAGSITTPIIYVTSSDHREGGGGLNDTGLDTNSGILSKLTWNGSSWDMIHLVRGLPRSEENHASNGIWLDQGSNTIYIASGGHTNAGAPSNNFALTTEYALSAAILSVDLATIEALPTKVDAEGQSYKYDLPTVGNPGLIGGGDISAANVPWGGDDGLNQAMLVAGGPVQVYASGMRNPYDIVVTQAGHMYTADNGANGGWGGHPMNEGPPDTLGAIITSDVTNEYVPGEPGSSTPGDPFYGQQGDPMVNNLDGIHLVTAGYYGGHPNPIRANPSGAGILKDGTFYGPGHPSLPAAWPPVDPSLANPIEGDFQLPGVDNDALFTIPLSTNGITEYTATNFGGAYTGHILLATYGSAGKLMYSDPDETTGLASGWTVFASGIGNGLLDVTALGDAEIFPGTVWTISYHDSTISVLEPNDYGGTIPPFCSGDSLVNSDEDLDGFTNADEMDPRNATDPCSAASRPADHDGTLIGSFKVSDWNDPDDDDDGIPDLVDPFVIDPNNGADFTIADFPRNLPFFSSDPATGYFGLGFTGLMINGTTDYLYFHNPQTDLIAGGAAGQFTDPTASDGTAEGSANDIDNNYQLGIDVSAAAEPFWIRSQINAPFFSGGSSTDYMHGIYIGTGDQDNFILVALNGDGAGGGGFRVVSEVAGTPTSNVYPVSGILSELVISLYFKIDPIANTALPHYRTGTSGNPIALGSPIPITGSLLSAIQGTHTVSGQTTHMAMGFYASSGASPGFSASWDFVEFYLDSQSCVLDASPNPLDFGPISENTSKVLTVDLANALQFDINVTNIVITGTDASLFVPSTTTVNGITYSSDESFDITFTPTSTGPKTATAEIYHTCSASPILIPLSGTGATFSDILYRVNSGGGQVSAIDGNIDWEADTVGNQPYRVSSILAPDYNILGGGPKASLIRHSSLPSSVPDGIFYSEIWDQVYGEEIYYRFPVTGAPGTLYQVCLLMANSCSCTQSAGQRVFDIEIEGNIVSSGVDLSGTYGHNNGVMLCFPVAVDGNGFLDIRLIHDVDNPIINGVEIRGLDAGTFPVEMLDFNADVQGSDVILNWATASEINNEGFTVQMLPERDGAAAIFQDMGFVPGNGNTTEISEYDFTVKNLIPDTYIFRLKQVDFDGKFSYSPRIMATVLSADVSLYAFPNPTDGMLNVNLGSLDNQHIILSLFDATGRKIRTLFEGDITKGSQNWKYDISTLPNGIYMLRVESDNSAAVVKVMKF